MDPDSTDADSTDIQRQKLERGGRLHKIHWFIIGLSITLTIGAWYYSSVQVTLKNQGKFQREADQAIALIRERMELYENVLSGGVALIHSSGGNITYPQWKEYSDSLHIEQKYPGVNGIGVVYYIQPSNVSSFLERQREERPDFKIHPPHDKNEHWPITYIEPVETNQQAVGLDMAFEANRFTAIQQARDTGASQLTGPITLVQDDKRTPGFLFYIPFYKTPETPHNITERRKLILGATYAPFIMQNLMRGTLDSQQRQVSLTIRDGAEILFDDTLITRDPAPLYTQETSIEMHGRTWDFSIDSSLSFRTATSTNQPYWILFGGLVIDGFIFTLFLLMTRTNRRALKYADRITEALRVKTDKLEQSNADLEQLAYIASHDLRAPLNAIKQVATWIEEDCADILPDKSKKHLALLKKRSQRMTQLLHDLRSYSQVNQFDDDRETVNLKKTVENICFLFGREQTISCSAPNVDIEIQRVPFETVLRNLISNAIKHHDKGEGHITIRYARENGSHVLQVEDNGPGIPEDMHSKIFEMYQTLRPRDKIEGSGMGLAIVKKILEHYDGKICLVTGKEKGACFMIQWPVKQYTRA